MRDGRIHLLCLLVGLLVTSPLVAQRRPFQADSTWYRAIPQKPKVSARSKDYVEDLRKNSRYLGVTLKEWSVPVWQASDSTEVTKVELITEPGLRGKELESIKTKHEYWRSQRWNMVPIPPNAKTSGHDSKKYRDRHMAVISADGRYAWDFWQAKKDPISGAWQTRIVRRWELSGKGICSPYDHRGCCRVCPTSLLHGLIRYDDLVVNGAVKPNAKIDHALAFSYWGQQKKRPKLANFVAPCEKDNAGINPRPGAMPLGQRLQLNPKLDVDDPRYALSPAAKVIARGLQEFGMIFVENAGRGYNGLFAEDMIGKSQSWSGILRTDSLYKIPLSEFRAIEPL